MKGFHLLTLVLLTCSIGVFSPLRARAAEEATAATAAEATADLFVALAANDVDRAVAMTAPVKGVPPEAVREYYQRLAEHTKKGGPAQVVAHFACLTSRSQSFNRFSAVGPNQTLHWTGATRSS